MYFMWISFNKQNERKKMNKKLTCHCGGVEAEVSLPEWFKKTLLVAIVLFVKKRYTMINVIGLNDLKITKGEKLLKLYQYPL